MFNMCIFMNCPFRIKTRLTPLYSSLPVTVPPSSACDWLTFLTLPNRLSSFILNSQRQRVLANQRQVGRLGPPISDLSFASPLTRRLQVAA